MNLLRAVAPTAVAAAAAIAWGTLSAERPGPSAASGSPQLTAANAGAAAAARPDASYLWVGGDPEAVDPPAPLPSAPPPPAAPPLPWSGTNANLPPESRNLGAIDLQPPTAPNPVPGPVRRFTGTAAPFGYVTLPTQPGSPRVLCWRNPSTSYWVERVAGAWRVHRSDGGAAYDFTYRYSTGRDDAPAPAC